MVLSTLHLVVILVTHFYPTEVEMEIVKLQHLSAFNKNDKIFDVSVKFSSHVRSVR